MAKNNEVQAKVRVTIGGVTASKKNLQALQVSAEELSARLTELNQKKIKLVSENDVRGADAVVKEINKISSSLKATKQLIKEQEYELNTYTNILDNLTNTRLVHLQKGLRDLQLQMKNTLTVGDIKRYSELRSAYDQLLSTVEQLSGKAPNLNYVLSNIGKVANKTLADSISYMEGLIATTDRTTKRGRDNIKQWTAQLKTLRQEAATRAVSILQAPDKHSIAQVQEAVRSLKSLESSMTMDRKGIKVWEDYVDKIRQGEEYIKSFDRAQREAAEATRKQETMSVLDDPSKATLSEKQLQDAIKHGKELQQQIEFMGKDYIELGDKIKTAEERLKAYNEQQKKASLELSARTAITESASVRKPDGSFNISSSEAKARVESIEKYMGTLNMSTQADDIKEAKDALEVYNAALGKVKETVVDVSAVLSDPKNFNAEDISKAIRQLEEAGKALKASDFALPEDYAQAVQQNLEDVARLKSALADTGYSQSFVSRVITDARTGEASVEELEKAIAMTKEQLRHSKDTTVTEKLRQDLDVLNPQLELTRTSLSRVNETLGNVKGSNLARLKEAAERLKVELNDINISIDDFNAKAAQLKEVNAQIKKMEAQTKNAATAWEKAVSRLENWVLIYAGSQQIFDRLKMAYQGSLQLSDAMADVRKTTGLTADEVVRLSDEIQVLDTRISNEKLMQAAVEAGRIGLKTRQEVFEFTKASAITLTALEELDARAITSVMKLNGLLGETKRLGVQQAILSTASAINELSMASSAAQQPIIDFSRRFGGIAAQANINTAEVLGLGATIDALGQPIEMSSTALNKFTTALLSNGKVIAEDTGLSEDYIFQMTRQGHTIELMIEVLSKLNGMGGIGEISRYMGDMGGEGARMTAVISALAANLPFLREQIDLAKLSFEEGVSVINEYNIKNENAAAIMARVGNTIREHFVNSGMVDSITSAARALKRFVDFIYSGSDAAGAFWKLMVYFSGFILSNTRFMGGWAKSMAAWAIAVRNGERAFFSFGESAKTAGVKFTFFTKAVSAVRRWLAEIVISFNMAKVSAGTFTAAISAAGVALSGLKKLFLTLFAFNPFGMITIGISLLVDLFAKTKDVNGQLGQTRDAVMAANEAFEEEAYRIEKLRTRLDKANDSQLQAEVRAGKMADVISELNRSYGKEIGYVLDLAASYDEVRKAIDLVIISKRKQILQEEKARVSQGVREEYRDRNVQAGNDVKQVLQGFSTRNILGGKEYNFSESGIADLYSAIMQDIISSARLDGVASLGERTSEVIRTQAKAMAGGDESLEQLMYDTWMERVRNLNPVKDVIQLYTSQAQEIKKREGEVDNEILAESLAAVRQVQQAIADNLKRSSFVGKDPKDYTEDDENALQQIVSQYDHLLTLIDSAQNPDEWAAAKAKSDEFKSLQRDVLLAFVENPLRGIKMKVGHDGKLYKQVLQNGKYQYEAVQQMTDANLRMLQTNFKKAGVIYNKLVADNNNRIDSAVMEQARKLSDFRTAVKDIFARAGQTINEDGDLKLRDAEYVDRAAAQTDRDAQAAYKVLLQNMEEYYQKRKQILLAGLKAEGKTIKEKNVEVKKWEAEYRQGLVDMQNELLGRGDTFEESVFIRDVEQFKKAAALARDASKTFLDQVARDMEKNRSRIIELSFLPVNRGAGDAEKGIRKAYTAIIKDIEAFYAKQEALVNRDYLNQEITAETRNRRLEDIQQKHWQTRIAMQREVLGELGENGEKVDWFNEHMVDEEGNAVIRNLENFDYVVQHMADRSHNYQSVVAADMQNTINAQEEMLVKHKLKVDEILFGNDYQAQVDDEMTTALEMADLFWGETADRTAANAEKITAAMRQAAAMAHAVEADKFIGLLKQNEVFGKNVESMTAEQQQALVILLQQYHDKIIEADKKYADQRRKITEQMWKSGGYDNRYYNTEQSIQDRSEKVDLYHDFGAESNRKAYKERYRLTLEQWALEEWTMQMQYELAVRAGETEQQLLERRLEMAEMEKEMQRQVTDVYLEEYNRRAEKISQHAQQFGEFAGVMASAAWNSVEDRKKAGEELLKYIAQETTDYIREFLVRQVKERVLRRQGLVELKDSQKEKQDIEQKGQDTSLKITEIGGKLKTAVEEQVAGNVGSIAESAAAKSAATAVGKANVDAAAGIASGAAKTIGELGWWGIPLIAAIEGVISMLLSMAVGALSSTFGSDKSSGKSSSSKRLAAGMLTYASGRYPVQGDDGVTYDAQYEPQLQTRVYPGGHGKAHMALFSEVMPEMVISGRTTKIIQEDFPGLMSAILSIDKYGTLPQPRRMRRYADGNADEFEADWVQYPDGQPVESPVMAELRQSNTELRQAVAQLTSVLAGGIQANINMYGTGGIKESMDKADKFYSRNRIRTP